jgi:hypothetical protein
VPDLTTKGGVLGVIANGWQISGITNFASGVPVNVGFTGDLQSDSMGTAWWGTPDHVGYRIQNNTGASQDTTVAPTFSCDPRASGTDVGEKIVNVNCVGFPALGQSGPFASPYYIRYPSRWNFDVSLFKNFPIGQGSKKLQFRVGFFNIFNQAAPSPTTGQDVNLALQTACNVRVNGVPNGSGGTYDNVCDPTQGFSLTQNSIDNFGKVLLQRGKRVIEFALKFYF